MDPILKAYTDQVMAEAPEMQAAWAALEIDWHCPGRHGVVRGVPSAEAGKVQRVIEWHLGHGACRWTKAEGGLRDVEFVHMTKVSPPPKRPWQWCGETVLFTSWQATEMYEAMMSQQFSRSDEVWFTYKGQRRQGLVVQINRRTVSVMVAGEGRYTVPPTDLHRV